MKRPFSSRSLMYFSLILMLVMSSSTLNKSVDDVDGSFLTAKNVGSYRLGYNDCALNRTTVTDMTTVRNETSLLKSTSQNTLGDCLPRIVEPIEDSGDPEKNDIPLGFLSYKNSRYVHLYRNGSNTVVSQNGETLYNGIDSTLGIQKAIDFATNYGYGVYMHEGLYGVREQINFTENLHFKGNGLRTILDYSGIENSNTIAMGNGSILENIMLNGSGTNLPMDFTQRLLATDNSTIKNVMFANLGYGIDTRGSRNVTIENVLCFQLRSKNDWAACINGGNNTEDVKVDRFRVIHSNRGIELDSGTRNFTAQNGYLVNITNSEATGHEAFSIDTHSHYGGGGTDNIIFKNIVIEKSRAPSVKATASVNVTEILDIGDFPRNILFENITLRYPQSPWQINGVGIIVKNSTIVGSKENIFDVFEGSKNVTLNGLFIDSVEDEKYLISNKNGPIFDIEIVNSTIKGGQDRTRPFVIFNGINGLTMTGNSILGVQYPKLEMLKNATNIHQRGNFLSGSYEKGNTDDS